MKNKWLREAAVLGIAFNCMVPMMQVSVSANDNVTSSDVQKQIDKLHESDVTNITDNLQKSIDKISEIQYNSVPTQAEYSKTKNQIIELRKSVSAQSKIQQAKDISSLSSEFKNDKSMKYLLLMFSKGANDAAEQAMMDKSVSDNIKKLNTSLHIKEHDLSKTQDKLDQSINMQKGLATASSDKLSDIYKQVSGSDTKLQKQANEISDLTKSMLDDQINGKDKDAKAKQDKLNKLEDAFMKALLSSKDAKITKEQAEKLAKAQKALAEAQERTKLAEKENNDNEQAENKAKETPIDEVGFDNGSSSTVRLSDGATTSGDISYGSSSSSAPTAAAIPGWSFYKDKQPVNSLAMGNASYPDGQCTSYAAGRGRQFGMNVGNNWGNGREWGASASRAGFNVDNHPTPGSIVSFEPGVNGAAPLYGHVAFVEDVKPDGSFMVSESNVRGPFVTYRVISAPTSGMYFIHK